LLASFAGTIWVSEAIASTSPDQGIRNAQQAGIFIDPAIEPLMQRAPIGTCEHDPTLPGCPAVTAMIYDPDYFGRDTAPPSAKTSRRVKRLRARAKIAQSFLNYRCGVDVISDSPYKAAGQAQGDFRARCDPPVVEQDNYIALGKFGEQCNCWNVIKSRWIDNASIGVQHNYHIAIGCASTSYRAWRAQIDGYALMQGVWYAGTEVNYHNLYCNYP